MMKKILFIEDNKTKAEAVKSFILDNYDLFEIVIRESFTSGLRELFTNNYDVLFVDMSLPSREGISSSSINNFEQIGGHKIMSEMKRKNRKIPTVLITMFSEFGVGKNFMDIKELDLILTTEFKDFYLGYVYYSSKEEKWKSNLQNYIEDFI